MARWRINPTLWDLYQDIVQAHRTHLPEMRVRSSLGAMQYPEYLYALFSYSAYQYASVTPIRRINDFTLIDNLSDRHSVVFTNHPRLGVTRSIVLAFKGTNPADITDLTTDVLIFLGREGDAERFKHASEKVERLRGMFPEVPIVVCGHSLGGSLAIHVSRRYNVPCYSYNPAQGLCKVYLNQVNFFPQVRVFRIHGDLVSSLSGLDNVPGVVLFPPKPPVHNGYSSHSILNFLPDMVIPEEYDF